MYGNKFSSTLINRMKIWRITDTTSFIFSFFFEMENVFHLQNWTITNAVGVCIICPLDPHHRLKIFVFVIVFFSFKMKELGKISSMTIRIYKQILHLHVQLLRIQSKPLFKHIIDTFSWRQILVSYNVLFKSKKYETLSNNLQ